MFRTKAEIFAFIEEQRGRYPVTVLCRLYGVTRGGFYAWCSRGVSARAREDARLLGEIMRIHRASRGTYGSPRVYKVLRKQGERLGKKRVERLMRVHRIVGRAARLYRSNPGSHWFYTNIPNRKLLALASGVDQVWVGDITQFRIGKRWCFLATVMDWYTRRIIGWSLSRDKNTVLTLKALNRAVFNRRPGAGVIFHSDRGAEYASYAYRDRLGELGFIQSMNRPSKMTDNAHMESFYHSMKSDVIHGVTFETYEHLLSVIRSYMSFYNHCRIHTSLDGMTPVEYERYAA